MQHPGPLFGGYRRAVASFLICLGIGCHDSATEPQDLPLTGRWVTHMALCVGDWSTATLELQQVGSDLTGEITTLDGSDRPCTGIDLNILGVTRDSTGRATEFFGRSLGRCCGTVMSDYRFSRQPGT